VSAQASTSERGAIKGGLLDGMMRVYQKKRLGVGWGGMSRQFELTCRRASLSEM